VCIMHQCCGVDTSYGSWLGLTIPAYRWDVTTGAQQDEVATRLATEKASIAILERKKAYDVTLARLAEAEEARVAASAHDAALARVDKERAAAKAATVALAPPHDDGASSVPAPVDLHGAMLLQEAVALLNHHAQAVTINNIRSLVPIVLDIDSGTFNRWRDQFLLTLGKFSLQDHVHLDAPVSSLDWDQMDCVVKSWILSSLTDDLAEITSSQGGTALGLLARRESQFLENREKRAIQLETRFRIFLQGDLSIVEYRHRLQKMVDDLGALGEVVTNRTLVLNIIRSLNERFTHIRALLRRTRPFPSFLDAREDLTLEELTLANQQPSPAAALAATTKFAQ
jgi:hypothetical protein